MTITFEEVTLDMIGDGGLADDETLLEIANSELQRIAPMVLDDKRADKATVTLSISVTRSGDNGVIFGGTVKVAEPPKSSKGLAAFASDGKIVTAAHKQMALPGTERTIDENGKLSVIGGDK